MGMRDKGTVTFGLRELELAERRGRFKTLFQQGKGVKDLIEIAKTCNCTSTKVSDLLHPNLPASNFVTIEFLEATRDRLKKLSEAR